MDRKKWSEKKLHPTSTSHMFSKHDNGIGPLNEVEVLSKASTSSTSTSQLVMNESESSSDIISLDGSSDKNYTPPQPATSFRQALAVQRPSSSNDDQSSLVRKRKTLSPTSRPGPLSHKQAKLNHTLAHVDSSMASFLHPKGSKSETSDKSTSKSPPGFQLDQHKFPPQHKPGEPEDFFDNQENIDYFIEILTIKRDKYTHMSPIKEKPLSSNWKDFVLHYWPGMMDCCDLVFTSCKDFQAHFTTFHLPPKKMPSLKVIDASRIPCLTVE